MFSMRKAKFLTSITLVSCTCVFSPLSMAFASSVSDDSFEERTQPPTIRRPVTEACSDLRIEEYVGRLGTSELSNANFEALVSCGSQAIPALKTALSSKNRNTRAGAAYVLGEIAVNKQDENAIRIIETRETIETNSNVLHILQSYEEEQSYGGLSISSNQYYTSYDNIHRIMRRVQSQVSTPSPIICTLPGIQRIFPRCS